MNEFKNTQQEISNYLGAEFIAGVLRDNLLGFPTDIALNLIDGLQHESLEDNDLLRGAYRVLVELLPDRLRDLEGIEFAIADLVATHAASLREHVLSLSKTHNFGGRSADVSQLQRHKTCEKAVRTTCSGTA